MAALAETRQTRLTELTGSNAALLQSSAKGWVATSPLDFNQPVWGGFNCGKPVRVQCDDCQEDVERFRLSGSAIQVDRPGKHIGRGWLLPTCCRHGSSDSEHQRDYTQE